jgi:hypothetical protein
VCANVGRLIGKRWQVSQVALQMFLDGDTVALKAYLAGVRVGAVRDYFRRLGITPQPHHDSSMQAPVCHSLGDLGGDKRDAGNE